MSPKVALWFLLTSCIFVSLVHGRIHNLKLQNDNRHRMTLSTFGFLQGGTLAVNISMFTFKTTSVEAVNNKIFGFTLDKSNSPGLSNYVESIAECIWNKPEDTLVSVFFQFDLDNKRVNIAREGKVLQHLKIVSEPRKQYLFHNSLAHGEELATQTTGTTTTTTTTTPITPKTAVAGGDKNKKEGEGGQKASAGSDGAKTSKAPSRQAREAPKEKPKEAVKGPEVLQSDKVKDKEEVKAVPHPTSKPATGTDAPKGDKPSGLPDKPLVPTDDKAKDLVTSVPMSVSIQNSMAVFQTYFLVHIQTPEEEGLYNLFFHNCLHIDSLINLTLQIIEDNNGNYLSADEMPIPVLYFVFHLVFFVLTCVWFSVFRKAEEGVYKIHYLMLVVVFVKSVSCLFHGINMYMIQKNGIHVDAWAILWYIVYLARGALMFVTVLLIGAGWAFIKHVFSDREKKLFLVVMPLQILANVAWVIVEESEEGTSSYTTWNRIFMVVDLLCCFAILFPVIWSIRHLQEASRTDGKAAINLNKLKLFRFFYIQVVCYIYFTRIIVYLLKITLPFHYGWMRNLLDEVFLLCFFTLTGYKFRPTSDNPYLQVPVDSDEEDIEMEEVLTKTGNMDSLTRVNQGRVADEEEVVTTTTTTGTAIKQRESSHEFD